MQAVKRPRKPISLPEATEKLKAKRKPKLKTSMKYDWKINSDIGKGRSRITYVDGTPVANMDALVDVEDYPKTWFAERLVAAHNGELRDALNGE